MQADTSYAKRLGVMLELAWLTEHYSSNAFGLVMARFYPAAVTNQVLFFLDEAETPFGFMTYTYLAAPQHRKMLDDPNHAPPVWAWLPEPGEGTHLWVPDTVAVAPGADEIMRRIRRERFPKGQRVHAYRHRGRAPRLVTTRI